MARLLGGRHQPGARVVGNTRSRPLLERRDQCILRQLLRQPHVAHDARQAGDQARGLDAPDRIDRAASVGDTTRVRGLSGIPLVRSIRGRHAHG